MRKIKGLNTINFEWTIKQNGTAKNLSNDTIEVYIQHQLGKKVDVEGLAINGNVVSGMFPANKQEIGSYTLVMIGNRGTNVQYCIDHVNFVQIVAHSFQEGGTDCSNLSTSSVSLTSEITVPSNGIGIKSIVQTTTSNSDGGVNVVTITLDNNNTTTFQIKNGSKGSQGERGQQGIQGVQGERGLQGQQGESGHTPVITASKTNGVTTIYADGSPIATINDGSSIAISDSVKAEIIASVKSEINVPTKTSDLTNDSGFITSHQDISGKQDKLTPQQLANLNADHSQYLTSHQDISGKVDKVEGMGLSSNDYTTAEKDEVAKIAQLYRKLQVLDNTKTLSGTIKYGTDNKIENLHLEKGETYTLKFNVDNNNSSSSSWLRIFSGTIRKLNYEIAVGVKSVTTTYTPTEDMDVYVQVAFYGDASNGTISISGKSQLDKMSDKIDATATKVNALNSELATIEYDGSYNFRSVGLNNIISNIEVEEGTEFELTIGGEAVWSRAIIGFNEQAASTYRLKDYAVKGTTYKFTAPADISSFYVNVIELTTSGTISLTYKKDGKLNNAIANIENNKNSIDSINSTLPKLVGVNLMPAIKTLGSICFIFDDGDAKDDDVVTTFDSKNAKCGFALIGQSSFIATTGRYKKYLQYQQKGYSCLNHNSSDADLQSYSTEAEARTALVLGKNNLNSVGLTINGWVCPNNKYVDSYRTMLGTYHAYAFGGGYAPTQTYALNAKDRDILKICRTDIETSTLSDIKALIDSACNDGKLVVFYAHSARIGTTTSQYTYNDMQFYQDVLDYINGKVADGVCYFDAPDKVIKYFFGL